MGSRPLPPNQPALEMTTDAEVARLLIAHGAKVRYNDTTALHQARSGEVARVILAAGVEVNALNKYGHTPLHFAAMSARRDVAQTLLEAGADRTARDDSGKTPQMHAKDADLKRMLQ